MYSLYIELIKVVVPKQMKVMGKAKEVSTRDNILSVLHFLRFKCRAALMAFSSV